MTLAGPMSGQAWFMCPPCIQRIAYHDWKLERDSSLKEDDAVTKSGTSGYWAEKLAALYFRYQESSQGGRQDQSESRHKPDDVGQGLNNAEPRGWSERRRLDSSRNLIYISNQLTFVEHCSSFLSLHNKLPQI